MTVCVSASPQGAVSHEAIADVRWIDSSKSTSNVMSKAQAVEWLNKGNRLWVAGKTGAVEVKVAHGKTALLANRA